MMLNKRQTLILSDLEETDVLITSQSLADKFNVSLRTIRNDIDEISDYIKDTDADFIRIHGVGMRIVSNNKISKENVSYDNSNFAFYSEEDRNLLFFLSFIFNENPITSSFLSERFDISKGTVINETKNLDNLLLKYNLKINGIKNKGFYLLGNENDLAIAQYKILKQFRPQDICDFILNTDNGYIDDKLLNNIQSCLNYISNNMILIVNDIYSLRYMLAFLLHRLRINGLLKDETTIDLTSRFGKFILFIQYQTGYHFNDEEVTILKQILNIYTDYNEDLVDQNLLEIGVDIVIDNMVEFYPDIISEKDELHIDLTKHIKTTINNYSLNVISDNPLLDQIKKEYKHVFEHTKWALRDSQIYFGMTMSDEEIGFITLYFCRTLDKMQQISDAKVMVVCNTGRGASSFLARRILNNCPTVHIVAMNSYVDIVKDSDILQNIDLIISTIPLPEVNLPVVVVSPLLSETELSKVKEAIFIGHNKHTKDLSNRVINAAANRIVDTYVDYKNAKEFDDILSNVEASQNKYYGIDTALFYSTIDIETSNMLLSLYPNGITGEQMSNMAGLRLHLLMSVPRWFRKEFVKIGDFDMYRKDYPREYKAVRELILKLNEELQIEISEDEIGSIMQYLMM